MDLDGRLDVTATDAAVEFAFAVTNAGPDPVELTFRNGQVADVVVFEGGEEVWRWSDGRLFTQAIRTDCLAPGESIARQVAWADPVPGEFVAEASLEATDATCVVRSDFAVQPG